MAISFSNREAQVMDVLWEHGPSTVAQVRERLRDELAYTTVLTVLRIMETKGYVGRDEEGRAHRYFSRVTQRVARRNAIRHLATKFFQGSPEMLLTQLVAERKLSDDQMRRIRAILDEDKGEGER